MNPKMFAPHPAPGPSSTKAPRKIWRYLKASLIVLLLCLGLFARFYDLATHFSHCDDIGVAQTILENKATLSLPYFRWTLRNTEYADHDGIWKSSLRTADRFGLLAPGIGLTQYALGAISVPRGWTYAPLQFALTPLFISPDQSYRQLLFWGRFPSLIFSALGLLFILLLHRRLDPKASFSYGVVSLCLLSLSWENIIYAKQMESYAIGVLGAVLLVVFMFARIERTDDSFKSLAVLGSVPAILSYAQYQLLFLAPGFFAALLFAWSHDERNKGRVLCRMAIGGGTFIALITPLYLLFLRKLANRGLNWNVGPHQQFLFQLPSGGSLAEKVGYTLDYLIHNTFIVIKSNLAIVPFNHPVYAWLSALMLLLLLAGCISLGVTLDAKKRALACFFAVSAAVWLGLIFTQRITLSPTRHTLILLPYIAILVSEGLGFLFAQRWWRRVLPVSHAQASGVLALSLVCMFLSSFRTTITERHDPFSEAEIKRLAAAHHVGTIVAYDYTWNLDAMHLPSEGWRLQGMPPGIKVFHRERGLTPAEQTLRPIAFVSHRQPISASHFAALIAQVNESRPPLARFSHDFDRYTLVWSKSVRSNVEIDFSPDTKNGSNGYFMTIFEPKSCNVVSLRP